MRAEKWYFEIMVSAAATQMLELEVPVFITVRTGKLALTILMLSPVYKSTVTPGCEVEMAIYAAWEVRFIRKVRDASYPFAHCSLLRFAMVASLSFVKRERLSYSTRVYQIIVICGAI
jgi:hypothetical protein